MGLKEELISRLSLVRYRALPLPRGLRILISYYFVQIPSIRDAIQAFNSNITTISSLHSRSLDSASPEASQRANEELERLVEDTRALSNDLKVRIKNLEKKGGTGRDAAVRKQQVWLFLFAFNCCAELIVLPAFSHPPRSFLTLAHLGPIARYALSCALSHSLVEPTRHPHTLPQFSLTHPGRRRKIQIHRGDPKLPTGRTAVPDAVQAKDREAV